MTNDAALWQRALRRVWALGAQPSRGLDMSASLVTGTDDERGPVPAPGRGSLTDASTRRARAAYEALGEPRRAALDALLAAAPTDRHRAWVLRAAAAGATPAVLAAFASRIAGFRSPELDRSLDPLRQRPGVLRQQSPTTCGSATLVVARMLNDPVYALLLLHGYDARAERDVVGELGIRFREQERQVKGRTNDARGRAGRFSLPWPHRLGTPPWGARDEMDSQAGVAATRHGVVRIDSDSPRSRRQALLRVQASVDAGHPCPLFVGDGAIPRHVVLAVGVVAGSPVAGSPVAGSPVGGSLVVWDPASGGQVTIPGGDFADGTIAVAGWKRPWAAIVPSFVAIYDTV